MLEFIFMILLVAVASVMMVRFVLRSFLKKSAQAAGGFCGNCSNCSYGKVKKEKCKEKEDVFFQITHPEMVKSFLGKKA